jgi:organic radical activating enzyme
MIPSLLSIFLDYHCNFECQHCSVGSSPRTKFPMPEEILMKAIDDAKEIPTIRVVVFTGGEPTLRKDVLLRGIRRVREAGYLCRVVSNGWWASTPEKAREMVAELKAAGLNELNTSYDDFHAPFASVDKIVNLVRAALEADLRVAVGVIADPRSTYGSSRMREELCRGLEMTAEQLEARVYLLEDYPTPSGTGESLDVTGLDARAKLEMGCPEVIKTLSVHPDGTVKVCCGHTQFYSKDLTLGSLREERLAEMVDRGKQNIVYWLVHMLGPKRILDQLGVGGTYSSICHACHVLFGNHREALIEYLEKNRDKLFVQDVLFSDNLKRIAEVIIQNKESILRSFKRIQDSPEPKKHSLPVMA